MFRSKGLAPDAVQDTPPRIVGGSVSESGRVSLLRSRVQRQSGRVFIVVCCRDIPPSLSVYANLCLSSIVLHCCHPQGRHCSQYKACSIGVRFTHI